MTEQEVINHQLQTKIEIQDEKFNMFMNEMRDRDNQRHAEMMEIRTLIDNSNQHVRNLTITAMVGIIAAGAGIAAMVIAVLLK